MLELDANAWLWLLLLVAVVGVLYSSVGHGGASGYLAVMALLGVAPATMRPAALVMNIAVTVLVTVQFYRAGYFRASLFWPFALGSIPMAYLGGTWTVPEPVYKYLVGAALLVAALRLLIETKEGEAARPPPFAAACAVGAVLGFASGLTGVGGGIFLSPLLLFMRWADMRTTAAVSAPFILVNSIAGLVGYATTSEVWPSGLLPLSGAALVGAWIGSALAVRRLTPLRLRKLLGLVLGVAGLKMLALV